MRLVRQLSIITVALGAAACTAILGSFDVGPGGTSSADGGEGGGGEASGPLAVTPGDAKMGILRAQLFTATEDVTWSLQEGPQAGAIDAGGTYLSGPTPGTYHVVATSKADPSRTASVPIIVVNLAIVPLIGANGGPGNIDGAPLRAHFSGPQGVARLNDNSGNEKLYVADTLNNTIRYVDRQSAQVTTLAGKAGTSGTQDGAGDAARFLNPTQLEVDSAAKKLYVLDNRGTCVRMLDLNATPVSVTTVTGTCGVTGTSNGGGGTKATFQNILQMTLSDDGHSGLYVCDSSTMRRVDLVTSIGTTVDMFPGGSGIYCSRIANERDYSHTVVFMDTSGAIKRFPDVTSWPAAVASISTVIATSPDYFDTIAVSSGYGSEDALYATNGNKAVLYRLNHLNGIGGGSPTWDAAPFAGSANERKVVDGNLQTARFGGLGQVYAYPQNGALYVADPGGSIIRHVLTYQGSVDTLAGAVRTVGLVDGPRLTARMSGPLSVASDDQGFIYFGDTGIFDTSVPNNTIRKYDRNAAVLSTVTGIPTAPFDQSNPPSDGPKEQARFWLPIDLTFVKGKLYVVDNFAQAVRTVDVTTGAVSTLAGEKTVPGKSDGVGAAAHFSFAPAGSASGALAVLAGAITNDGTNLYVSDSFNFAIRKIVIATGEVSTLAGGTQGALNGTGTAAQFQFPGGLAYDSGNLYVADWQDQTIRRVNLATGVVDGFIGLSGQAGDKDGDAATATLNNPFRVTADGIGNLYIAELPFASNGLSGVIRRIDIKNRSISSFAGRPGAVGLQPGPIPSSVNCPTTMAATPAHDLLFGDFCENTVAIIQPL